MTKIVQYIFLGVMPVIILVLGWFSWQRNHDYERLSAEYTVLEKEKTQLSQQNAELVAQVQNLETANGVLDTEITTAKNELGVGSADGESLQNMIIGLKNRHQERVTQSELKIGELNNQLTRAKENADKVLKDENANLSKQIRAAEEVNGRLQEKLTRVNQINEEIKNFNEKIKQIVEE